jgi:hypothetical protein
MVRELGVGFDALVGAGSQLPALLIAHVSKNC